MHEASHALVAYYLGDPTAKMRGRLSLNPMRHLDLMGSLIFLATQKIGWGKPVPVDERNFERPVRDSALTALAGPMSNFVFAFVLMLPLSYLGKYLPVAVASFMWVTFHLNIYLGIFNLLPFPPLDGSKILGLMMPKSLHGVYARYLQNGFRYFVAIILVDILLLPEVLGYSVIGRVMQVMHDAIFAVMLLGT